MDALRVALALAALLTAGPSAAQAPPRSTAPFCVEWRFDETAQQWQAVTIACPAPSPAPVASPSPAGPALTVVGWGHFAGAACGRFPVQTFPADPPAGQPRPVLRRVTYRVDALDLGETTTRPFAIEVDAEALPEGRHTLTVTAEFVDGSVTTATHPIVTTRTPCPSPTPSASPSPSGSPSPAPSASPTPSPGPSASPTPPTGRLGWPDAPIGTGASAKVLGTSADFTGALRLGKSGWTNEGSGGKSYGIGPEVAWERPGDPEGFAPHRLWADAGEGWLRARRIVNAYPVHIIVPGGTRYVGIEWKDTLLDPSETSRHVADAVHGPRLRLGDRVVCELTTDGRRRPGGGVMIDARWKRTVCDLGSPVPSETRLVLGGGQYGSSEFSGGPALVHALIASPNPIPARTAVAGFWPDVADLTPTGDLRDRQGRPYVPILCSLGGAQREAVAPAVLMGCDTAIVGPDPQGAGHRRYTNGPGKSQARVISASQVQYTLEGMLPMVRAAGLLPVLWPSRDVTWRAYIRALGDSMTWGGPGWQDRFDGTWRGSRRVMDQRLTRYVRDAADVPFIYLWDEWDHESQNWMGFVEMVREARARANRLVPGVFTMNTVMGWKHGYHEMGFAVGDLVLTDFYPKVGREPELYEHVQNLTRAAGRRPFGTVSNTSLQYEWPVTDRTKMLGPAYQRSVIYYGLVSGGRTHWYFNDNCVIEQMDDWCADYYRSLKPVNAEMAALADVVHASARLLGETVAESRLGGYPTRYAATGDGTSEDRRVATRFVESARRRVLMTITTAASAHTARLTVASVRKGDHIPVLFENRTVTADQDGSFEDRFGRFERHVYEVPK